MTSVRLLLVRHGQTPFNRDLKLQGKTNEGLTSLGIRQATALAQALRSESPAAVYSSPLKRSLETDGLIASAHNITAKINSGLAEMDIGLLDGLTYKEISEKFPEFVRLWESDPTKAVPPSGETISRLQTRCWAAINGIVKVHPEGTVIIVSHSFSIASIVCKAIKMPLSSFKSLRIDLGSISELSIYDDAAILSRLNDTSHLNGLKAK